MLATLREALISQSIALNPVTVTFERTERVDQGGYFTTQTTTIGPFQARVFQFLWGDPETGGATEPGRDHRGQYYGLLAGSDCAVAAGPYVDDTVDAGTLGRFRVVDVYPQTVEGALVGVQARLERIGGA